DVNYLNWVGAGAARQGGNAGAAAMKEIQIRRNKIQIFRNKIQAGRNKFQIRRNEIQIQKPSISFSELSLFNDLRFLRVRPGSSPVLRSSFPIPPAPLKRVKDWRHFTIADSAFPERPAPFPSDPSAAERHCAKKGNPGSTEHPRVVR